MPAVPIKSFFCLFTNIEVLPTPPLPHLPSPASMSRCPSFECLEGDQDWETDALISSPGHGAATLGEAQQAATERPQRWMLLGRLTSIQEIKFMYHTFSGEPEYIYWVTKLVYHWRFFSTQLFLFLIDVFF